MRAWEFAKIDYIKTKQQMVMLPVLLLVIVTIMEISKEGNVNGVTLFCYMIFMMTIFSTQAFGACRQQESGFLRLLPADTRDRVAGRFLYGFTMMGIAAGMGIGTQIIYRARGYAATSLDFPLCLIGFALGMLIMTAEFVFFYLFGENQGQQLLGIVRTLPGMCFFFATANLSSAIMEEPEKIAYIMQNIGSWLRVLAWGSAVLSMVVFLAAIELCVKVTEKRDY